MPPLCGLRFIANKVSVMFMLAHVGEQVNIENVLLFFSSNVNMLPTFIFLIPIYDLVYDYGVIEK